MLTALIGPIANLAGTWFENKVAKTKADGEAKVAEAKARATVAEKGAAGEVAWEGKMADATVDSWKDEFALFFLEHLCSLSNSLDSKTCTNCNI